MSKEPFNLLIAPDVPLKFPCGQRTVSDFKRKGTHSAGVEKSALSVPAES